MAKSARSSSEANGNIYFSISNHATKTGVNADRGFPSLSTEFAATQASWNSFSRPLGVDSRTMKVRGSGWIDEEAALITFAGVHSVVFGKKASSVICARAASPERQDSGLRAEPV